MLPLFASFLLVTRDVVLPFGTAARIFHSNSALGLVTLSLLWCAGPMRRRQVRLHDNTLRMVAPTALHKYL